MAIAMMVTSIQLPPVQVSVEEVPASTSMLKAFDATILANKAKASSWNENNGTEGDGPASWAFDNPESSTWWHSNYPGDENKPSETNKIWIQAGLGKAWNVSYITYTGRPGLQGVVTNYKVYIVNKNDPSDTPTDEDFYGTAEAPKEPIASGTLESVNTVQTISFEKITEATHIRFVVLGTNDGSFCAARDIAIYGSDENYGANKTELEAAIAEAEAKEEDKESYSEELYNVLQEALDKANALKDDSQVTQIAVDEAEQELRTALENLIRKNRIKNI